MTSADRRTLPKLKLYFVRMTQEMNEMILDRRSILTRKWKCPGRLCTPGKPYRADRSRRVFRFSRALLMPCRPETRNADVRIALKSRPEKSRRVDNVNFATAAPIRQRVSFARETGGRKKEKEREEQIEKGR